MIAPMRGAGRDLQLADHRPPPFVEGDRVVMLPSDAEAFLQPLRKWCKEMRQATVTQCFVPDHGSEYVVVVVFDTRRPPKSPADYTFTFHPDDLQRIW